MYEFQMKFSNSKWNLGYECQMNFYGFKIINQNFKNLIENLQKVGFLGTQIPQVSVG